MKKRILLLVLLALLLGCLCVQADTLTLLPRRLTLYVGSDGQGEGKTLEATVSPQRPLRFTSNRPGIAKVNEITGLVTPRKAGNARITCRTIGRPVLKQVCRVTVKRQPPTQLSLDPQELILASGASRQLTPQILPENAVNKRVTWRSSAAEIAGVNKNGMVTGHSQGTAFITCRTREGGLSAVCQVTVDYSDSDIYYLIIGQEHYAPHASDLDSSAVDAKRFRAIIETMRFGHKGKMGEIRYDLTGNEIRSALDDLSRKGMDANDLTYVYYSGHGMSSSSRRYRGALAGVDGKAVPVDQVRKYLDKVPGTVIVVLDCCLSGQYIQAKGASPTREQQGRFLADMVGAFASPSPDPSSKGTVSLISNNPRKNKYRIMASCKPLEFSWACSEEEDAYGFFTYYLAQGLGIVRKGNSFIHQGAIPADKDLDGYVSLQEIHQYTAPRVTQIIRELVDAVQTVMVWPANSSTPIFARIGC